MVYPAAFTNYEEYFKFCLAFLDKNKWIFNFPVTEVLVNDTLSHIPDSWIDALSSLSEEELNKFPHSIKGIWPDSLVTFCNHCEKLKLKPCKFDSSDALEVPELIKLGVKPKKTHEVMHLVPLIHKHCQVENINKIIDIGSGMGYLDQFLYLKYNYRILGVEFGKKLVESSRIQFEKLRSSLPADHEGEVRYILNRVAPETLSAVRDEINFFFQEKVLNEEANLKKKLSSFLNSDTFYTSSSYVNNIKNLSIEEISSPSKIVNSSEKSGDQSLCEAVEPAKRTCDQLCLVGLHTCGDLCIDSLNLFLTTENCKLCILLACCYHKLTKNSSNNSNSFQNSHETFQNFPLSFSLKQVISTVPHMLSILQIPFFRLAANETYVRWYEESTLGREIQLFYTMARAVIQLYFSQNGFIMKKSKRRCVTKSTVNDFKSYLLCLLSRCQIWNEFGEIIDSSDPILVQNMCQLWEQKKHKRKLVKIILCLQANIQFVAESLIVIDRVKYLLENNVKSVKVIKALNDSISPRALALFAKK